MLTTQQKIDVGNVCEVLAANELQGGKRHGATLDERLPGLLNLVTETLEDLYTIDSSNEDIEVIGNYLISICRHYARANALLSLGGGGAVAPITPTTAPDPLIFIVDASTTPIINGQSSKTITDFIGYNLSFARGGIWQSTVATEPSYYTWNKVTGLFTCFDAAMTGELFILMPV